MKNNPEKAGKEKKLYAYNKEKINENGIFSLIVIFADRWRNLTPILPQISQKIHDFILVKSIIS